MTVYTKEFTDSKDEMHSSSLHRYFYKRISFSHEYELRVLISLEMAAEHCPDLPRNGILVPVDIAKLIQNIYISPEIDDLVFIKEVNSLISSYKYSFPVLHSDLSKDPIY